MSTHKNELLVEDFMMTLGQFPVLTEKTIFKEALEEMGRYHLGISCIVDSDSKLLGVVTDGDIRRKILKVQKPISALLVDDALDHSIKHPVVINSKETVLRAVELMELKKIWDLPVINEDQELIGLLHLHSAAKAILTIRCPN